MFTFLHRPSGDAAFIDIRQGTYHDVLAFTVVRFYRWHHSERLLMAGQSWKTGKHFQGQNGLDKLRAQMLVIFTCRQNYG